MKTCGFALFGILMATLMGCAIAKPMRNVTSAADLGDQTVMLLQTHFEADQRSFREFGCTMEIKNRSTGELYSIQLDNGDQTLFLVGTPGKYESGTVDCPGQRIWDSSDPLLSSVTVREGKIAYAGRISLKFSGGNLTVSRGDRKESLSLLHDALKGLPESQRKNVISGFSGRPITLKMAEARSASGFHLIIKGNEDIDTADFFSALRKCEESVLQDDPILVGHIMYVGSYREGKLQKLTKRENMHAFASDFELCVSDAFQNFKPRKKTRFEAHLSY